MLLHIIPEVIYQFMAILEDYFLNTIDSGLEGIMVKKINSIYQPGKRNFNWIKLKRWLTVTLKILLIVLFLDIIEVMATRFLWNWSFFSWNI